MADAVRVGDGDRVERTPSLSPHAAAPCIHAASLLCHPYVMMVHPRCKPSCRPQVMVFESHTESVARVQQIWKYIPQRLYERCAAPPRGMRMRRGPTVWHAHAAYTCGVRVQHVRVACTCSMVSRVGHAPAACACSMVRTQVPDGRVLPHHRRRRLHQQAESSRRAYGRRHVALGTWPQAPWPQARGPRPQVGEPGSERWAG